MNHRSGLIFWALFLMAISSLVATASAQQTCTSLSSLKLPHTTFTLAGSVPAGPFTPHHRPGHGHTVEEPAFCRVAGVIKPTADSNIKFEVWMPLSGWNGRFQDFGNTGFAGMVHYDLMGPALRQGYATASTDDGHIGSGDPTWAINHPAKIVDFGYRAVHETAKDAKIIINSFYGRSPRESYFVGCSDGGREALMEAQRFPDDFNGIVAGAPANFWTHLMVGFVWDEQATMGDRASYIPTSKLPVIQKGALAACDALDSIKDGIIADPRRCHFDPGTLECKGAIGPGCLTAAQVEAVRKIYAGPRNKRTGQPIFPGYEPGAEAASGDWPSWITGEGSGTPQQFFFGNGFFADMVFQNPKWNFRTLNFDSDVSLADSKLAPILNATNPDLRPFEAHGGKLIQYHGWADSAIAPLNSVNYYQNVVATIKGKSLTQGNGLESAWNFYRLFMVPGMGHCLGGPGPDSFGGPFQPKSERRDADHNVVSALERWVEDGVAPNKLVATKYVDNHPKDGVARTWLLCPYPEVAKWTGKGSIDDAANFVCTILHNRTRSGKSHRNQQP